MSANDRPSDRRLMAAAALIIFGRLCFFAATILVVTCLLFGWPPLLRVSLGLAAAVLQLLFAAFLVRDFRWLWAVPIQGVALAGLTISAAMAKVRFARQPHRLTSYEALVAAIGLVVFAACVVFLRRHNKVPRQRTNVRRRA